MTACAGDWVEVRSKEEILATLDKNGCFEGMPFMPEMFEFCGRRIRVAKRAHKTCDTTNSSITTTASRSLPNAVLLGGLRCDGSAHGGCQATCSIFWKEAWLKRLNADGTPAAASTPAAPAPVGAGGCTEQDVINATRNGVSASGKPVWRCQATALPEYTTPLRNRDLGQFAEDLTSGNVGPGVMAMTFTYFIYQKITGFNAPARWLYNKFQAIWGGVPYLDRVGHLEDSTAAPVCELGLQPGELVRVKPAEEILATVDKKNFNRGLYFDPEMIPYCGGIYRVHSRVHQFLDEKTGVMRTPKMPAIILENVWCRVRTNNGRSFCPRATYTWWREAWLERVPEASAPTAKTALGARSYLKDLVKEEA